MIEMVRQRKRYTVCEISYPGGANKRFAISQEMIVTVVLQAVSLRKGEVGYARVKPSLRCVYCNQVTGIVVLMCHRDDTDILESSLSAVSINVKAVIYSAKRFPICTLQAQLNVSLKNLYKNLAIR